MRGVKEMVGSGISVGFGRGRWLVMERHLLGPASARQHSKWQAGFVACASRRIRVIRRERPRARRFTLSFRHVFTNTRNTEYLWATRVRLYELRGMRNYSVLMSP